MDAVKAAFDAVPRAGFLPRRAQSRSGFDGPIIIGHGQTNSQPRTVLSMLRLLDVRPGHRILDVGAGSGWTTALLAHLTGPEGSVIGVELVPELAAWGAQNLGRTGFGWATIRQAIPPVLGWPAEAPYDRILVSAEARTLPQELVDQLGDGGRIVVPVGGTMTLGVRHGGDLETSEHGRYRFVPLL
ncbi:MAG: Protein-L-isoaspartate(D-aspartate)O-methyltrans ferase [Marmoricola sp.]|nr:Protein-L-isoaspartate(D-aspartate)O-methyltrans ferase [Marmoricola sp.]